MEIIHVSSRGQIVIPERVRKQFKLKEGDRLILLQQGNELILRKEQDVEKLLAEGWTALAAQALAETWNNPEDEKEWTQYL